MLLAAYLRRDRDRARQIVAALGEDDVEEVDGGMVLIADVTAEFGQTQGEAYRIFAAMTGLDHEAVIVAAADRIDRDPQAPPDSDFEWRALIHFRAATCTAYLETSGKDTQQIAAGFALTARE